MHLTNFWWSLPTWLTDKVKPNGKTTLSFTAYKADDGFWYFTKPALLTRKESLVSTRGSAPPSSSARTASGLLEKEAAMSGVQPRLSWTLTEAFASRRIPTQSTDPCRLAQSNAVAPSSSRASGS